MAARSPKRDACLEMLNWGMTVEQVAKQYGVVPYRIREIIGQEPIKKNVSNANANQNWRENNPERYQEQYTRQNNSEERRAYRLRFDHERRGTLTPERYWAAWRMSRKWAAEVGLIVTPERFERARQMAFEWAEKQGII